MRKRDLRSFGAPRLYNEKTKKLEYAFFCGTSPKFVDAIATMLEKETFEKQDYLFKEGDHCFSMYFISSGSVIICSGSDVHDVEILSRGRHCGDLAFFGTTRRLSNAIAREHTECLVLRNRHFQSILERFPEEKEYFSQVALERKKDLKQIQQLQRKIESHCLRPRRAWRKGEDSDSDRDATDDPAPLLPKDEAAPLPDTEIPGAYPQMSKMNILQLAAPPRHGPEQLEPLMPEPLPESRYQHAKMGKELATVGRAAFARKMQVAEALSKEMAQAPVTASSMRSMRPQSALSRHERFDKKVEVDEVRKPSKGSRRPAVKKVLAEDDDDDGFDVNFDLKVDLQRLDFNAIDPWRRAVSA